MQLSDLSTFMAVGLVYDGFGVLILGIAFFGKSPRIMVDESKIYIGYNKKLLRSLVQTRADGMMGTALLVIGFFLQWMGSIGIAHDAVGMILLVLLIAIVCFYAFIARRSLIDTQTKVIEAMYREKETD